MKNLKGHFLVASRSLADPNFVRTVVLMLEHSESGAAGVVLNRPTGATLSEIAEQVLDEPDDWEKPIYLGGPVPGPLMVLHTVEDLADRPVVDGLFSTLDLEKIRELIRLRVEPSLFVANYAGWGAGQLEMELIQDSWLSSPSDPALALEGGDASMWEAVVRRISRTMLADALGIAGLPEDPNLN